MLRKKFDALQTFINFKNQVKLQLGHKIKSIKTFWGGGYRASLIFFFSHGIIHKNSCSHTYEQNGV